MLSLSLFSFRPSKLILNHVFLFQASDMEQNSADDNILANLDLNLGLKATYNERETKSRNSGPDEGDQVEKINLSEDMEMNNGTDSEVPNKLKRKAVAPDLEMRV